MDPTNRLRIATRIHFALLRHYGEHVDVAGLLRGDGETSEVLWVCEASGHTELVGLARQFGATGPAAARQAERARRSDATAAASVANSAPQDAAWAHDTSGFGLTRPPETAPGELQAPTSAGWLNPTSWLRRSARR